VHVSCLVERHYFLSYLCAKGGFNGLRHIVQLLVRIVDQVHDDHDPSTGDELVPSQRGCKPQSRAFQVCVLRISTSKLDTRVFIGCLPVEDQFVIVEG
jgi:hypothetical protein